MYEFSQHESGTQRLPISRKIAAWETKRSYSSISIQDSARKASQINWTLQEVSCTTRIPNELSVLLWDAFPSTRISTLVSAVIIRHLCSGIVLDIMSTFIALQSFSWYFWWVLMLRWTESSACPEGISFSSTVLTSLSSPHNLTSPCFMSNWGWAQETNTSEISSKWSILSRQSIYKVSHVKENTNPLQLDWNSYHK